MKRKVELKRLSSLIVDSFDISSKFQEYFTQVKDPRVERTRWHLLTEAMGAMSGDKPLCVYAFGSVQILNQQIINLMNIFDEVIARVVV